MLITMNRRNFLKLSAASLGSGALQMAGLSVAQQVNSASWQMQFKAALKEKPWLAIYQTAANEAFASRAEVTGRWPKELKGVLYRNGPARHEIGDFRYHHWFDGDGMIQAFEISADGITHKAKMIRTHKFKRENAAGHALYPGFGTLPLDPIPVTNPDSMNSANISVLPHHNKLLALWEGGSPWEIDPDTLETRGIHHFTEHTAGVPFSAHPRVEPDGTLWNFGYLSGARLIVLWHLDRNGKLLNIGKIKSDPISMPHDFVVTSRHIILMIPPLNFEPSQHSSFLDAHQWQPNKPTRILVVDKFDFSKYRWLELPSQWIFHFGNGWEDSAGIIRFDGARYTDPSIMTNTFRDVMRGVTTPASFSRQHQYQIDTRKWSISEAPILPSEIITEFPVIDPRVSTRRYSRLVMLCTNNNQPALHGHLNGVCSFNLESGKLNSYYYPDTQIPEEHLFVAKPGSRPESGGWVIGTTHDWEKNKTNLNVFDVETIDAGPIAIATIPYALPFGLHGKFVEN